MVVSIVTTEQRFWAKVLKTESCWLWTASKRNKGYGAFAYTRNGRMVQDRAHRYSWEIHKGEIPDGLCVLHNCPSGDNPACVNPAHLFLGTKAVNNADMMAKGRYNYTRAIVQDGSAYERGESHHNAKLSAETIRSIRARKESGASYRQISREFGIAVPHAFKIVTRKLWAQIQ